MTCPDRIVSQLVVFFQLWIVLNVGTVYLGSLSAWDFVSFDSVHSGFCPRVVPSNCESVHLGVCLF